jgi:hypothetical protein
LGTWDTILLIQGSKGHPTGTWRSRFASLVILGSFLGACLGLVWGLFWACFGLVLGLFCFVGFFGPQNDWKRLFGGRSVLGPTFGSDLEASGRQKYCFRARGSAKNTIHSEPFLCAPGTSFHTPKLVFLANIPNNWPLVCAFSNDSILIPF